MQDNNNIDIFSTLSKIFPKNILEVFNNQVSLLMICLIISSILTIKSELNPLMELNELLYKLFTFILDKFKIVISFFYFILSINLSLSIKNNLINFHSFDKLIIILFIILFISIFIIYPLLYKIIKKQHTFSFFLKLLKILFHAFLSQDLNFTLSFSLKKLDYKYISSFLLSQFGTLIISSLSFKFMLNSYIAFDFSVIEYIKLVFFLFISSFLSLFFPSQSLVSNLIFTSIFFKNGLEKNSYLILSPILFLLNSLIIILNSANALFIIESKKV